MKKFLCAAALTAFLAGCHRENSTPAGQLPVKAVTPIPRPAMDKRLAMLFPGSKVDKLTIGTAGEFFAVTKGGKPNGNAALVPLRDAKGKEFQLLVVTRPDGKIKLIAVGLKGSAGQSLEALNLNLHLNRFLGKSRAELQKVVGYRSGLDAKTAQLAESTLTGALEMLEQKTR